MSASVSVVIPAYQAAAFIHRPVQSILRQTWTDWELVIASDDGGDYELLLRERGLFDSRIRCISTGGVGTGAAHARNMGLEAARGDLIAALDADDELTPEALEVLVPLAREHGAAYSRIRFLNHDTGVELENMDRLLGSGPVGLEDILSSQIHTYAGIVFDRSRVRARWPEWMQRWEDVYFYVSCFDDLERMYHVAEPHYVYYRREGSICNRPETAREYTDWAVELERRIEQGDSLGLRNEAPRATFLRFLRSRRVVETSFLEALAQGLCSDYLAFIKLRPELFYQLDPERTPA